MNRPLFVFLPALLGLVWPSASQSLVRDPQTGDYVLTYTDLTDTARTLNIVAVDKVDASLAVQVSPSGTSLVYHYVLANGPTGRQAIGFLDVLCPAGDSTLSAAAPGSWNARAEANGKLDGAEGLWLCNYSFRDDGAWVSPGSTLSDLRINSAWLPAVRAARAYGLAALAVLPSEVADTPDTVLTLIERTQGFGFFTGGGRAVSVVAPARPPSALADPAAGLDSVAVDLSQSCALGWIASQGVCSDLTAKLVQGRQTLGQGDNTGTRTNLQGFLTDLEAQHGPGLPVNDNAYWLLKVNVEFILRHLPTGGATAAVFFTGSGGTANPPTLSLSTAAPTGTTAKYKDSPAINFNGGNPWAQVGTWTAAPALSSGTLTTLGDAHVWVGLKNSDDIGTNFDLRVEAYKNGTPVASGDTRCVQGITRNANQAKEVAVVFAAFPATSFNGTTDVLTVKVLTRVGTNASGALCGGHSNAVGLRMYFDAVNRAAQFTTTF